MISLLKKLFLRYVGQAVALFFILAIHTSSKACSPLNVPILISQAIVGQTLQLQWQSTTIWIGPSCPDEIDVEIACDAAPFTGSSLYTFTTATQILVGPPTNYALQSIDISGLCAGMAYKFRARERSAGPTGAVSLWSATFTFTTPGVFNPPTVSIIPSQNVICPGQSANLNVVATGCGNSYSTFSWTPPAGLSCTNCASPIASPTVNTLYNVFVQGSQLSCWTGAASVSITVANPTVIVTTPSICPGQTGTIVASGADSFYWSFGAFPNGPNTGGAAPLVTTNYTVTGNTSGCTNTALATVVVYPVPIIAVNSPAACFGQTINLTASGAATYTWSGPLGFTSTLQNPSIPNATMPMGGSYSVIATSAQGCTNTATSLVAVQALPVPLISSNNPPCLNATLSFTGSGANTFTWTGPNGFSSNLQGPAINNVPALAAGVYTMIGAVNSCTASTTTTITLRSIPSPTAQSNSPICSGQTLSLSASGGVGYSWMGPNFLATQQNTTIPNTNVNQAGNYTLVATGPNGCTNSISIIVIINPLPISTNSNILVCLNQPLFLNGSGGTGYLWQGPLGFSSVSQNTAVASVNYGNGGQYSVTVTSALGCSVMAIASVTVLSLPSPTIIATSSICANSNLALGSAGGNSYVWSGPNGYSSSFPNPVINNIPLANSGVYTLSATVGSCIGVTTKSITVMPLPPEVAANTGPACDTKTLQLTAGGAPNCLWQFPDGGSSNTPAPFFSSVTMSTSGVYTVTVTDNNNCKTTSSTTVIIHPNPVVTTLGATVCAGQPAVITASGGVTYQWTGPMNFNSTVSHATITSVTNMNAGVYMVMVGSVNSCTSVSGVNVVAQVLPTPSMIVTPRACLNSTISLEGFGGVSYFWEGPQDFESPLQNKIFVANSMGHSGIYTLTAYNEQGCAGKAFGNIIIDPLPDGVLDSDEGNRCVPFCAKFNLAPISTTPILSTTWKVNGLVIPADTFRYCVIEAGKHILTGIFEDANGCANTATFVIDAHPKPTADFSYDPINPVENSDQVLFTNTSVGEQITKLSWYFESNSGYRSNSRLVSYIFNEAGVIPVSLVVKNAWGCLDTVVKPVKVESDFVIYVPNVFTPNGDENNETFQPKGRGVVTYDLKIFDRWGEKMFETNNMEEGWDGYFKDKACKSDVYQWRIQAGDGRGHTKDMSGHVTLYR